jgi:hypothetical protein
MGLGGCSFYSRRRRLAKAAFAMAGAVAAVKLGVRQSGGGRDPNTVSTGVRRCLDRAADQWAPMVSDFFF